MISLAIVVLRIVDGTVHLTLAGLVVLIILAVISSG